MNRYVLIGIVIFAIIALIFWFFWLKPSQKEPEQPAQFAQSNSYRASYKIYEIESRKQKQTETEPERRTFRFFDTFAPVVAPFKEIIENITPSTKMPAASLSPSTSSSEAYLKGEKQQNPPLGVRGARGVMKNSLTDQQIFDWIWPPTYREDLAAIERLYTQKNYITSRAPTDFNDEQNLYQFLALTLDVSEQKGWITSSDAAILRKGLKETLPLVVERDKNMLRQGLYPVSFLPKDMDIARLRWVIFANIAQASPGWVTSGDCYKDDNPANPIPGPNIWAECCNCGLICTPSGCDFVKDCGPQSIKCDVPLGCLNLACGNFPNAIWDPTTGICGCG